MPAVRALGQALADAVATAEGRPQVPVPDLGPAVVMDQLAVLAYDWRLAGLDEAQLGAQLRDLRRTLGDGRHGSGH